MGCGSSRWTFWNVLANKTFNVQFLSAQSSFIRAQNGSQSKIGNVKLKYFVESVPSVKKGSCTNRQTPFLNFQRPPLPSPLPPTNSPHNASFKFATGAICDECKSEIKISLPPVCHLIFLNTTRQWDQNCKRCFTVSTTYWPIHLSIFMHKTISLYNNIRIVFGSIPPSCTIYLWDLE